MSADFYDLALMLLVGYGLGVVTVFVTDDVRAYIRQRRP